MSLSASSISRETRCDGLTHETYYSSRAQQHADDAISSKAHPKIEPGVDDRLRNQQWSPEQISCKLKAEGLTSVSHESVYQHVYKDQRCEGELYRHLRYNTKTYKNRGLSRERCGDREMDTVIGRIGGKVLVTMVERKTHYLKVLLAENKEALEATTSVISALKPISDTFNSSNQSPPVALAA